MNAILDKLLPLIFTKIPGLSALNGYKRTIGNLMLIAAAALYKAQEFYPSEPWIAPTIAFIGFVIRILGDLHADSKTRQAP